MKHTKAILKTLIITAPLLLSSCNLLPNISPSGRKRSSEESAAVSSKHTHKWDEWYVTSEPTCTVDGEQERICTICGERQTKAIKASHRWGEWVTLTESTCVENGIEERRCTVCQEIDQRYLDLAPHTWGEGEVVLEPTCTESGEIRYICSVCHGERSEYVSPLGHDYAQDEYGEDIVDWSYAPTCLEYGEGTKECQRCHHLEYVYMDPLGHDIQLVDDGIEPAYGMAKVRLYECSRCGIASFGFKATEVTVESMEHLVFESDGVDVGARFWGRPIGNAMQLDDTGSASESNHEAVFDPTVQGDFFEYRFELTHDQALALQNCYCYCDAKPAAYLGGQDFWACDPSATEWTQGYYIEDNPDTPDIDETGTPIQDYRYILYVDGVVQQFDQSISVPVSGSRGSEPRQEYIMPYLFNLHEGENSISLRMAGGYRSIFYNFIFRPANY